ncbi:ATP synthase F1 subunit delta [Mycoplasmopsis felifaucium]|uniref:ATP synthase F1 subunit delta n=1 Tax=Mycoplasmopsis felifaucium TaxID=35768 RepID=UPI000489632C|nr:ATP synthase F1 subunit delta [Mycoplasmopsis felifaucium]
MYSKANPDGYALALFELLKEQKLVEKTYNFLAEFDDFINNDEIITTVLSNINETKEERLSLIDDISQKMSISKDTDIFKNFLKVLVDRNTASLLPRIMSAYLTMAQSYLNILSGKIYTAYPLKKETLNQIITKLEKEKNKRVILKDYIDESLISGFKIVLGNEIIEHNAETDLKKLLLSITRKGGING